jgi:hypothetical protein
MVRVIVVDKRIGCIGTTNLMTKHRFGLVFVGPWTDIDWSYAVRLRSINIWVGPGPVSVAVAPFGRQKPDSIDKCALSDKKPKTAKAPPVIGVAESGITCMTRSALIQNCPSWQQGCMQFENTPA